MYYTVNLRFITYLHTLFETRIRFSLPLHVGILEKVLRLEPESIPTDHFYA